MRLAPGLGGSHCSQGLSVTRHKLASLSDGGRRGALCPAQGHNTGKLSSHKDKTGHLGQMRPGHPDVKAGTEQRARA